MKAILRGGPVDKREMDDIPESTEYINIPSANLANPQFARYARVGDDRFGGEKRALFNFDNVYPGAGV
jgi:hypothetical protein